MSAAVSPSRHSIVLVKGRSMSPTRLIINDPPPAPPALQLALISSRATSSSPRDLSPPTRLTRLRVFLAAQSLTSILLVFVPISLILNFATTASPVTLFTTACLAIVPLAGIMGDATEQLADRFGPGVGGLLNASFGNAAELILALFGCFRGLDELVKASLCGSMIGNILLVLGMSILMGGLKYKEQRFSKQAAHSEATMAIVAAVAFLVPAIFHSIVTAGGDVTTDEHPLSLGIAVLLIVTYALMLFFQLRTHAAWFNEKTEASGEEKREEGDAVSSSQPLVAADDDTQGGEVDLEMTPKTVKKHRSLHSMIAFDPSSVSPMTKKMFARKIVKQGQMKEEREKREKELLSGRKAEMDSSRGSGSGNSTVMRVQSLSPRHDRVILKQSDSNSDKREQGEIPGSVNNNRPIRPSPLGMAVEGQAAFVPIRSPLALPAVSEAAPPVPVEVVEAHEEPAPFHQALLSLAVSCILVALLSDVLTDSATAAGQAVGLSSSFLGLVVVAIIGNAAEHSTAVMAAWHDNLNVSLSIAFGSALQIAMFVCPVVVLLSYARDDVYGPMDLIVGELEVFAVAVGGVVSWMVVMGGGSNWLEGLMLLMIYLIIALAFYFLPNTVV